MSTSTKVGNLAKDQDWIALCGDHFWCPTVLDFINIFVAKSQYYRTWKGTFEQAGNYPIMKDWLAGEKDRKSDKSVWGFTKSGGLYSLEDLKTWIQQQKRKDELASRKGSQSPTKSNSESTSKKQTQLPSKKGKAKDKKDKKGKSKAKRSSSEESEEE